MSLFAGSAVVRASDSEQSRAQGTNALLYAPSGASGVPTGKGEQCIKHQWDPIKDVWTHTRTTVIMSPKPFANGSMRAAYRLIDLGMPEGQRDFVAKVCLNKKESNQVYWDDVALQSIARVWASRFNEHRPAKKVQFLDAYVLEFCDRPKSPVCAVEPYVQGKYVKYSNNFGWTDPRRNTPHAFSHFTFDQSKGRLVICDIQGVNDIYTDPQIHSLDMKCGKGNLREQGIQKFLLTHSCNAICRDLGLPPVGGAKPRSDCLGTINPANAVVRAGPISGTVGLEVIVKGDGQTSACIISGIDPRLRQQTAASLIASGDRILEVDGMSATGRNIMWILQHISGASETFVTLMIAHQQGSRSTVRLRRLPIRPRPDPFAGAAAGAVPPMLLDGLYVQERESVPRPPVDRKFISPESIVKDEETPGQCIDTVRLGEGFHLDTNDSEASSGPVGWQHRQLVDTPPSPPHPSQLKPSPAHNVDNTVMRQPLPALHCDTVTPMWCYDVQQGWQVLPPAESQKLESAYTAKQEKCSILDQSSGSLLLIASFKDRSVELPALGKTGRLRRGTWFYEGTPGIWCPYDEFEAANLEDKWRSGASECDLRGTFYVILRTNDSNDRSMFQYNRESDFCRRVVRGYSQRPCPPANEIVL